MKRRAEFLDAFLRGAGPSPELLGSFASGLMVVGLLADLLYDLLTAPAESLSVAWRPLAASLVLTGLGYLLYRRDRRRKSTVHVDVDESQLAPAHPGLIWLFGPGRFDHLLFALEHHHREGGATHCWLVMQDVASVREAYSRLSEEILTRGIATRLHPVYIQTLDVEGTYKAARAVFEREAIEEGLDPDQVIADVTGGTKPMTSGMVLAAITTGGALEYVESERDAEGHPIPDTLRVVSVDLGFYPMAEK